MSEFQTLADGELDDMVRHVGADRITQAAGLEQNLFNLPFPSEEDFEPPPAKMRLARPVTVKRMRGIDIVNMKHGVPGGIGVIQSGGNRNSPSSVKRRSGKKRPITVGGSL